MQLLTKPVLCTGAHCYSPSLTSCLIIRNLSSLCSHLTSLAVLLSHSTSETLTVTASTQYSPLGLTAASSDLNLPTFRRQWVSETLAYLNNLTRLSTRENYIEFCSSENCRTYNSIKCTYPRTSNGKMLSVNKEISN